MWLRGRCGLESHSTVAISPQVSSPLLGRGREGFSSQFSPPWEKPGKAPQVGSPLLGRGWGEAPQVSTPLPWGGGGGGFLLFSFTKPFARQPVLRNKRITVGNTRVLSLFATHWLWGCYEKQGKIQRKNMVKSIAICVILACVLLHFARWNDADERVSWRRLQDNKP